jgi:hypothetical protein
VKTAIEAQSSKLEGIASSVDSMGNKLNSSISDLSSVNSQGFRKLELALLALG